MGDPFDPPDDFAGAFESAFAGLQVRVETACAAEAEWPAQIVAAVRAALEFAASDPGAIRLLAVRALVERPDGPSRYLRLIDHFAARLRAGAPADDRRPASTEQALVGGLATMIGEHLRSGEEMRLPRLAPEFAEMLLVPYLGRAEARRWATG